MLAQEGFQLGLHIVSVLRLGGATVFSPFVKVKFAFQVNARQLFINQRAAGEGVGDRIDFHCSGMENIIQAFQVNDEYENNLNKCKTLPFQLKLPTLPS